MRGGLVGGFAIFCCFIRIGSMETVGPGCSFNILFTCLGFSSPWPILFISGDLIVLLGS